MLKQHHRAEIRKREERLVNRVQEVEDAVDAGLYSQSEADALLRKDFGDDYRDQLDHVSQHLERDAKIRKSIAAFALLAVLIVPVILYGPDLTGFAVLQIDESSTIPVNQTFSEYSSLTLPINATLSSLRVTGSYEGAGSFSVTYNNQTIHAGEVSGGFAILLSANGQTDETDSRTLAFSGECDQTCSLNSSAPHAVDVAVVNGSLQIDSFTYTTPRFINESASPQEPVEQLEPELSEPEESADQEPVEQPQEQNPEPIQLSSSSQEYAVDVGLEFSEPTVLLTGIDAQLTSLSVTGEYTGSDAYVLALRDANDTLRAIAGDPLLLDDLDNLTFTNDQNASNFTETLDRSCLQTCNLSAPGPQQLEYYGQDGVLSIDQLHYSVQQEDPVQNVSQPQDNQSQQPSRSVQEELAIPRTGSIPTGGVCAVTAQCQNQDDICHSNVFEGDTQSRRCAPPTSCVADSGQNVFSALSTVSDSTCFASADDSVWLADAGRWQVMDPQERLLVLIDRFGNMGVLGDTVTNAQSFSDDYQWSAKSGEVKGSVAYTTGDLRIAGDIIQRSNFNPAGIAIREDDRRISGVLNILITLQQTGNLVLPGDYVDNLALS